MTSRIYKTPTLGVRNSLKMASKAQINNYLYTLVEEIMSFFKLNDKGDNEDKD